MDIACSHSTMMCLTELGFKMPPTCRFRTVQQFEISRFREPCLSIRTEISTLDSRIVLKHPSHTTGTYLTEHRYGVDAAAAMITYFVISATTRHVTRQRFGRVGQGSYASYLSEKVSRSMYITVATATATLAPIGQPAVGY